MIYNMLANMLAGMMVVAGMSLLLCFYMLFRNEWVYTVRRKWIENDLYDFKSRAPSYNHMLYCRWWCWNANKFYTPLSKN
jgi:hypothetical protein